MIGHVFRDTGYSISLGVNENNTKQLSSFVLNLFK